MTHSTALRAAIVATLFIASTAQAQWTTIADFSSNLGSTFVVNDGQTAITSIDETGFVFAPTIDSDNENAAMTRLVVTSPLLQKARAVRWKITTRGCEENSFSAGARAAMSADEDGAIRYAQAMVRRLQNGHFEGVTDPENLLEVEVRSDDYDEYYVANDMFLNVVNKSSVVTMSLNKRTVAASHSRGGSTRIALPKITTADSVAKSLTFSAITQKAGRAGCKISFDNIRLLMD